MHVRNVRALRGAAGEGGGSSPGSAGSGKRSGGARTPDGSPAGRSMLPALSSPQLAASSPLSATGDLSTLTLDVDEYLDQLAAKRADSGSAALTAHLSTEELEEHLKVAELEVEAHKRRQDGITRGLSVLRNLEKAVQGVLEDDAFAERLIRHQDKMVRRARAERGDPDLRTRNLEGDVRRLEKDRARVQGKLQGVTARRNNEHDAFMAAFKSQVALMQKLEATALARLDKLSTRADNMHRSVRLLVSRRRRRSVAATGAGGGTAGPEADELRPATASITRAASMRVTPSAPPKRKGGKRRPRSGRRKEADGLVATELLNAQREKAAAMKAYNRLHASNRKLQKQLSESNEALVEKENLINALRRQQRQQVLALQKKMVSLAKQMHSIKDDDYEI